MFYLCRFSACFSCRLLQVLSPFVSFLALTPIIECVAVLSRILVHFAPLMPPSKSFLCLAFSVRARFDSLALILLMINLAPLPFLSAYFGFLIYKVSASLSALSPLPPSLPPSEYNELSSFSCFLLRASTLVSIPPKSTTTRRR
jgi:hypothetical protein